VAASFQDLGDRVVFSNGDGTFAVWKQTTAGPGGTQVGPGYIGRATMRDGTRVCEGFVPASLSANDPRWGGIGGVGWHHFRANGEPDIWNRGWDFVPHRADRGWVEVSPYVNAAGEVRASFKAEWRDGYEELVMSARYDYIVDDSQVKAWVTVRQHAGAAGPPPFAKEPKLCVGVAPNVAGGFRPTHLDVLNGQSTVVRTVDLANDPKLQDPTSGTVQLGQTTGRVRLRFRSAVRNFNVVARASQEPAYGADGRPTSYGQRADWWGAPYGMDRWAQLANGRAEFEPSPCAAYCRQGAGGTLTRQWEVAKRGTEPCVEVMLHAWEGGSGVPDCLCCARAFEPGEAWTSFLSVSDEAGWQL